MLFRVITWVIVIGFVYRFLSRYIFPAVRITSTTNDRLRQMQDQMREMERKMQENTSTKKRVKKDGDYIDYEEVG